MPFASYPAYLFAASSCSLLLKGVRLDFSSSCPNLPLLKGHDAAGHWSRLHGPENSLDVTLAPSEPHHQPCICRLEGDIGDLYLKRSLSDFAIVPFHSSIE